MKYTAAVEAVATIGQIGHRTLCSDIDFAARFRCKTVDGLKQVGLYEYPCSTQLNLVRCV